MKNFLSAVILLVSSVSFGQQAQLPKKGKVDAAAASDPRPRGRPERPLKRLEVVDEDQLPTPTKPEVPEKKTIEPPKLSAGEITEYMLTKKNSKYIYVVRTGVSLPATLEFPEPLADVPLCGDCTVAGSKDKDAANSLFLVSGGKAGSTRFVVRPNTYPEDVGVSPHDFITTITFPLKSYTLVVRVEYTKDRNAVTDLVRWILPEREDENKFVTDTLKQEKARLAAEFSEKVQVTARTELLKMFLQPNRCLSGIRVESKTVRRGHVVLNMKQLCRFGDYLLAKFTIENRDKLPFLMGAAAIGVTTAKDEDFSPLNTEALTLSGETTVAFGEKIEVVVGATSREAPAFTLRVPELREADGRTLYVRDLSF